MVGVAMSSRLEQAKRPVSPVLAGPYGHPFHPILVTVPIGAWVCSIVFDIASRFVSHPGVLAQGSVWLIGLGVLGALAAATVGFLDFLGLPRRTRAFRVGLLHMSLNLAVTAAYAVNFAWRMGDYGQAAPVGFPMLVLSVLSVAVLAVSGYLGGMLAYHYGVRVADEATQAEGYREDS
jgi:uncharacterized membrane protein